MASIVNKFLPQKEEENSNSLSIVPEYIQREQELAVVVRRLVSTEYSFVFS